MTTNITATGERSRRREDIKDLRRTTRSSLSISAAQQSTTEPTHHSPTQHSNPIPSLPTSNTPISKMQFTIASTLATALLATSASATWCNFYYDSACTNDANGGISFDCANPGRFGTGGGFVQCHSTKGNNDACGVIRWTEQANGDVLGATSVGVATTGVSACLGTNGGG